MTSLKVGDTGFVFDHVSKERFPARVVDVNLVGNSIYNTATVVSVGGVDQFLKISQDGKYSHPNGFVWEEKAVEHPKYFTYVKHNGVAAKFAKAIVGASFIYNYDEFAGVITAQSSDDGKTFFNYEFTPFIKKEEVDSEEEVPETTTSDEVKEKIQQFVSPEDALNFLFKLLKGEVK